MAEYLPAQLEHIRKSTPTVEGQQRKTPAPMTHPLLGLQARAGNQAIARMIQRESEGPELEEEELQMKHDAALQRSEGAEAEEEELQMKHDASLQRSEGAEAEEEELQMKHDTSLQRSEGAEAEEEELQMKHDTSLQRSEGAETEEEELQMKHDASPQVGLEGGAVGDVIESQVNSMRGQGSGVPGSIRSQMEAATGADLSGVRVHQGAEADTLNRQLTAKAFTTGSDIFLRNDSKPSDSQLMAHELAHVVQQSSGRVASGGGGMTAGAANDPLEAEADNLAHAVLSGTAQRHAEESPA
ncbi:MAG: DUF4157 domain-containing protein [Dehalococcoidia bacterium]